MHLVASPEASYGMEATSTLPAIEAGAAGSGGGESGAGASGSGTPGGGGSAPVPEPGALFLVGTGLLGVALTARLRRRSDHKTEG